MRKGKYFHYKRILLQCLKDKNFIIKIGEDFTETTGLAQELGIPISSWYDITRDLEESCQIIIRRKHRQVGGRSVCMVYEIQLTKAGLEFLTRFSHA